ncbi:MAG: hypothetical protein EOP08_07325 [Proteobacteria bacterium]|nr:MAG: hypothetical protein EOP08_07325 [Pseudomonadota bacterium]
MTPSLIEGRIDADQFKLYSLIWKRAVACQMAHAVFDTVAIDLRAGAAASAGGADSHLFRANGSTLVSPGYIAVYQEGRDDGVDDDNDHVLPAMKEGDVVSLVSLIGNQHFTEPPPRYSEASLVKALEEHGIGRPSTYASIISTLKDREYVEMDGRRFIATDIGKIVNRFLTKYFTAYVQYSFTADMEDELDAISRGEEPWVTPLEKFWKPFITLVDQTEKTVSRDEVAQSRELGMHPELGRPVSVRMGRFGAFVQAGTKDDVEKPKFAGLRPGQKMDSITLDQALELFKLPREVGETVDGDKITVAIGRFGPYIKYGAKYVSLKDPDDPYTITLARCIECIDAKKVLDANRIIQEFGDTGVQVLNGRYGPYITDKERNARIPKDRDPKTLTLEECQALLAAAPLRPMRGRFGRGAKGSKFGKNAGTKARAKTPAKAAAAPVDGAGKGNGNGNVKAKAAPKKKKAKAKAKAKSKAKKAKATTKVKTDGPTGAVKTAAAE